MVWLPHNRSHPVPSSPMVLYDAAAALNVLQRLTRSSSVGVACVAYLETHRRP